MTEAIKGLPPGYMVGDRPPARRHDSEFIECPLCGGQMKKGSRSCQKCIKDRDTSDPAERAVRRERQERFDLALRAGWTLKDIFADPDEEYVPGRDRLPTMEEICARNPGVVMRCRPDIVISMWWRKSRE